MIDSHPAALALFAHPDDEFGLYPSLAAARAEGRRVVCVWLTDGGWGGQDIQRRCDESRRVLGRMGLAPADMHFAGAELRIPDGSLHLHLDVAVAWLREKFGDLPEESPLWIPAWEGGHHDHDAAHLAGIALAETCRASPRQFTLYQGRDLPGPCFRVLAPMPENGPLEPLTVSPRERLRCLRRCFAYPSQWKSFVGLLPFYALRMLQRHPFSLQPVDRKRTAGRPHPGPMLYERRGGPSWEAFAAATARWRASDTASA